MPPGDSEHIERGEMSRLAPRFYVELSADTSSELRLAALRRKHSRQKKQIAGADRFHMDAEWLGWRQE